MTEVDELLSRVTLDVEDLAALPVDAIRKTVRENRVARIRGLFDPAKVRAVLRGIAANFDAANDRRHDPRDTEAVRRNFQKLQIGANSGIGTKRTLGRFLRVLYNPIFADDIYGMRESFVQLAQLRNLLYGLPRDYAVYGTDEGLWTCSRLLQYPAGGGFIVPHRDHFSQVVTVEEDLGYYQPLLLLTEPGEDYREGGAYIDAGEQRILYEQACHAGDVVVYDGRTIHGVADVDPLAPLDLDVFNGRVAAFVSIYRELEPGSGGYGELSAKANERFGSE